MNKKIAIIIIAVALILIAIGFFIKTKVNFSKEIYNGNCMNMGLAVKDGDDIYYNKYPEGIYKIDKLGEETKITDDIAYSINIKNEWIFYVTLGNSYKLDILRIKKDGSSRQVVTSINSIDTAIYLSDNWIYYLENEEDNSFITKVSVEGDSKFKVLETPVQKFQLTMGHIYYTDTNNRIRRINIDGTNDKEISKTGTAKNFQVTGNYVYYIGEKSNCLERINLKNGKSQVVSRDIMSEPFNVVNEVVYYYNSKTKMLCYYNIGTLEKRELAKINGGIRS